DLAIYAYYFLVMGIAIRFLEFALPENIQRKFADIKIRISDYLDRSDDINFYLPEMDDISRWLYARAPRIYWFFTGIRMRILRTINWKISVSKGPSGNSRPQNRRLPLTGSGKNIALISDISINIAIFLSMFLIISLIYGMLVDWWYVQRYLSNLVLIILALIGLRIFIWLGFYSEVLK
ncbi:MAG TPA: hypothetical protein VIO11_06655, partial [Candidatus Methanoperedens sp.]